MRRDELLDNAEKNADEGQHADDVVVRVMRDAMAVPNRIDTDTESDIEPGDASKVDLNNGVARRNSMGESVTSQ